MNVNNYITVRTVFVVATVLEGILAIPIFGWWFALSNGFLILLVAFIIHVLALTLASKAAVPTHAPIVGLIASMLGWVPLLGWFLHLAAFIFYLITLMGIHDPREDETNEKVDGDVKDAEIVEDEEPEEEIEEVEAEPAKA